MKIMDIIMSLIVIVVGGAFLTCGGIVINKPEMGSMGIFSIFIGIPFFVRGIMELRKALKKKS